VVRLPVRRNRLLMELLATGVFVLGIGALLLPLVQSDGGSRLLGSRLPRVHAEPPSQTEAEQNPDTAPPTDAKQEVGSTMGLAALSQPPAGAPTVHGGSGSTDSEDGSDTRASHRSPSSPSPHSSGASSTENAAGLTAGGQAETEALLSTVALGEKSAAADGLGDDARGIYLEGLRHLRVGLSDGSRSSVAAALESFSLVVQLAPRFAPGYLHQGVCFYRVQNYSDAQTAFIEAVKLDDDLWEHCPLLYYSDCGTGWPTDAEGTWGTENATAMGEFVRLKPADGRVELGITPSTSLFGGRSVSDVRMTVRVRFSTPEEGFWLPKVGCRARVHDEDRDGSVYLGAEVTAEGGVSMYKVTHPGGVVKTTPIVTGTSHVAVGQWHRFTLELTGGIYRVSLDGSEVISNAGDPNAGLISSGWTSFYARATPSSPVDLADLLITRAYPRIP
jgi:hypothetical protein